MAHEPDNFPPEPTWFLLGCMLLFLAQLAVYVGLIAQGLWHYLGWI
jgi:hypothetical protein